VEQPAPQGIGMAVAFDWGLTVQILLTPILTTFFGNSNAYTLPVGNPLLKNVLSFVIAWPVAIGIAFFGQSLRLGRRWTRKIQIGVIAWRLSRPASARWFATVTKAEARKRHGGAWGWMIALWAIAGGVLQTIASMR